MEMNHFTVTYSSALILKPLQCHYAIEEDSEGDNDSDEFYYVGQVSSDESLRYIYVHNISVCGICAVLL